MFPKCPELLTLESNKAESKQVLHDLPGLRQIHYALPKARLLTELMVEVLNDGLPACSSCALALCLVAFEKVHIILWTWLVWGIIQRLLDGLGGKLARQALVVLLLQRKPSCNTSLMIGLWFSACLSLLCHSQCLD